MIEGQTLAAAVIPVHIAVPAAQLETIINDHIAAGKKRLAADIDTAREDLARRCGKLSIDWKAGGGIFLGHATQPEERALIDREWDPAMSMFGDARDLDRVRIVRRKWFPFQPRKVMTAPCGTIHSNQKGDACCDCFANNMVHVWQAQRRGEWYLLMNRHPWCRYNYNLRLGWPLERHGIEQQAAKNLAYRAIISRREDANRQCPAAQPDAPRTLPFEAGDIGGLQRPGHAGRDMAGRDNARHPPAPSVAVAARRQR